MIYEDVYEPIELIAVFKNGGMQPLKFKWNDRVYRIGKINGEWTSEEGVNRYYHYSVMVGGPDCFELCYDSKNMTWELAKVCLEG